jgi:hypothetical protein
VEAFNSEPLSDSALLQSYGNGVLRDRGIDPTYSPADFKAARDILAEIANGPLHQLNSKDKSTRWMSFYMQARGLDSRWHAWLHPFLHTTTMTKMTMTTRVRSATANEND